MVNPIEIKKHITQEKESLLDALRAGDIDGAQASSNLSHSVDDSLIQLVEHHLGAFKDKIAVVMTGANGREEICPHSDLDMFLLVDDTLFDGQKIPDGQDEYSEGFGGLYYALMDTRMGISSLVMRTPTHCAEDIVADQETWTQMLDRRKLWGSDAKYEEMERKIAAIDTKKRVAFITDKFAEYDKRLDKLTQETQSTVKDGIAYGGRFAIVEPNIKNSYGGLRGFQTAKWVSDEYKNIPGANPLSTTLISEDDKNAAEMAYTNLLTIRWHMHDAAGSEDDKLHSHVQPEIASRMGYTDVSEFMRDYFQSTHEIAHHAKMVCCDVAESLKVKPPGAEDAQMIMITANEDGSVSPLQMMTAFKERTDNGKVLHHTAMQHIKHNAHTIDDTFRHSPEANRMMLDILSSDNAEDTLVRMNRLDFLPNFIPEVAGIQRLMQFDPYHAYTVDDHTFNAIGNVSRLAHGEYENLSQTATELAQNLSQQDRAVLGVALLLHDVHKADQPDNMKTYNAQLVQNIGSRLGLKDDALDQASWLAENHFLLKHTARYQDIEDTATIDSFTEKVPDIKHLELLRIMTLADTLALGPGRLKPHATYRADSVFEKAKNQMMGMSDQFNKRSFTLPDDYNDGVPYVRISPNKALGADVLTIITPDKPYLMENIAATLEQSGTNVMNARVKTIPNGSIRAVNNFVIQNDGGKQHSERQAEALKEKLITAIQSSDRMPQLEKPPSNHPGTNPKNQVFPVQAEVNFTNALSDDNTTVQITARDKAGLLHTLTRVFNDMDLEMQHASLTRQGHKAVNVFQLHKRGGGQISPTAQIAIKDAIMQHIAEEQPEIS